MKKILLIILPIFLLFGCKEQKMEYSFEKVGSTSPYGVIRIYTDEINKIKHQTVSENEEIYKTSYVLENEKEYDYFTNKYGDFTLFYPQRDKYALEIYKEYIDKKNLSNIPYDFDFYDVFKSKPANTGEEKDIIIFLPSIDESVSIYPKGTVSNKKLTIEIKRETEGLTTDKAIINRKQMIIINLWNDFEIESVTFEGKEIQSLEEQLKK